VYRTRQALLTAFALSVVLAGCGGATKSTSAPSSAVTGDAAASPAPLASPSATPTPAADSTSSATGAGSASPAAMTSVATDASSQPAAAAVPLDASLAPALLTLADLPAGWTSTDNASSDNSASLFDSSSGSSSTDLCGNDRLDDGLIGQNSTGFMPADLADGLRILVDGVARYQPGKAKAAMDGFQQALKACSGTTTQADDSGATTTLTVAALDLPALGDQAAGFHVAAQSTPFGLGLEIAVVRRGDLLAVVADFDLGDDVPQDGLIQQLAGKAAARLDAVAGL
jgi:hypothetical protein